MLFSEDAGIGCKQVCNELRSRHVEAAQQAEVRERIWPRTSLTRRAIHLSAGWVSLSVTLSRRALSFLTRSRPGCQACGSECRPPPTLNCNSNLTSSSSSISPDKFLYCPRGSELCLRSHFLPGALPRSSAHWKDTWK